MSVETAEKTKKTKTKLTGTRAIVYCALFAALTAALSQVSFNIGVIPLSLGLLGVLLCGSLLGARLGTFTVLAYIAMGLLGLPVFAGFKSTAALLGPTGGYIIGYVFSAFLAGLASSFVQKKRRTDRQEVNLKSKIIRFAFMFGLLAAAVIVCYLLGTVWFCIYANTSFAKALGLCVFPFLPGDAIKVTVCGLLTVRLKPFIK